MQGNTCRAIVIMKPTNGQVNKQPRQKTELCDSVRARCSHFICMISSNTCSALMSLVRNTHNTIYLFDQNARHLHVNLKQHLCETTARTKRLWFFSFFKSSKQFQQRFSCWKMWCNLYDFSSFISIVRNFTGKNTKLSYFIRAFSYMVKTFEKKT